MPLSGKSALAEYLQRREDVCRHGEEVSFFCHELDREIEALEGESIRAVFAAKGEGYFRQLENALLRSFLSLPPSKRDRIVFCGGGVVVSEKTRATLSEFDAVVYLKANPETLISRMSPDEIAKRPLLCGEAESPPERLKRLYERRKEWYERVATHVIEVDGKTRDEVAREWIHMRMAEE